MVIDPWIASTAMTVIGGLVVYTVTSKRAYPFDKVVLKLELAITKKIDALDKKFSVQMSDIKGELKAKRARERKQDTCSVLIKKETNNGN